MFVITDCTTGILLKNSGGGGGGDFGQLFYEKKAFISLAY